MLKLTKWEVEYLTSEVTKGIRRSVSQRKSTKSLERLLEKLEQYGTQKGLPKK